METIRICFVCLGNICRSPTAEAVFLRLVDEQGLSDRFEIDSAGTGGYHVGERAHRDTRAAGRERGLDVTSISRQFVKGDFARFDYVVAMDQSNRAHLERLGPGEKIHLFRDFDPDSAKDSEVPDPYYGGGFPEVIDICEAASLGLLRELRKSHAL